MFKRLHLKMTAINTFCATIIVMAITVTCLYAYENGLEQKEYALFMNQASNAFSYLKSESLLTLDWYSASSENVLLAIEDNGLPLRFVEMSLSEHQQDAVAAAKDTASRDYQFNISSANTAQVVTRQVDFPYSFQGENFYCAAAFIPKEYGFMSALLLYPLAPMEQSIREQRILIASLTLLAVLLLGCFSYFFTRGMIHPIEKNQQSQSEFIAAASHELRSPLTVIRSSMSAIKKADRQKSVRFEEIIDSELKRASRLIDDMLSLANADNHNWKLLVQETDVTELMQYALETHLAPAATKNITLRLATSDNAVIFCRIDRQRMEQVLDILINNAITYTPTGGTITLSVKGEKNRCRILVTDSGIGIADEDKAKIFERFYRVDSARKDKEHFGLGLSIAFEIIKLHHGSIQVMDAVGGGTVFAISLISLS